MATTAPPLNCTGINVNSTECVHAAQHRDAEAFATSLVINVVLFLIFLVLFLTFRKRSKPVYEPMADENKAGSMSVAPPADGLLGWLRSAWAVPDRELEAKRGLDAVVYLKTLKYLFFITVSYCFYGVVILFPVHATGERGNVALAQLSMGNVENKSARLAADLVGVFFNSVLANAALYLLYREYFRLRVRYRVRRSKAENFSVVVREVDPGLTEGEIAAEFEKVFPGRVYAVQRAYRTKKLWERLKDRQKMGLKWEKYSGLLWLRGERKVVSNKPPLYLCGGDKVDANSFFKARYEELDEEVRNRVVNHEHKPAGVAFVTFTNRETAQIASQTVLRHAIFFQPVSLLRCAFCTLTSA